ncbi:unnamed protein product, partial [Prorocentrum cordatum]
MEGLMKNGEVVPVFAKPNGDWNKTRDRADEISRLIPMAASDEDWGDFITGVEAVHQKLSIPMGESVASFLDREHAGENLFETDFGANLAWGAEPVRQSLPRDLIGLEVRDNDLDRKGKIVGLTVNPDAVLSVHWGDGFEAELSCEEFRRLHSPGASVHFDIGTPSPRARKGCRRNKGDH